MFYLGDKMKMGQSHVEVSKLLCLEISHNGLDISYKLKKKTQKKKKKNG